MPEPTLCRLDELPDPGARGFTLGEDEIFVVRRDAGVFAYKNHCPHNGVNLNWLPDQFLSLDETLIQCAMHGAQFRIEDGLCVWGPCNGRSLEAVPVEIVDGYVRLKA